jgi:hypothetical protein
MAKFCAFFREKSRERDGAEYGITPQNRAIALSRQKRQKNVFRSHRRYTRDLAETEFSRSAENFFKGYDAGRRIETGAPGEYPPYQYDPKSERDDEQNARKCREFRDVMRDKQNTKRKKGKEQGAQPVIPLVPEQPSALYDKRLQSTVTAQNVEKLISSSNLELAAS